MTPAKPRPIPTPVQPKSFPYFSTPLKTYLGVMLPICALEVFLIFSRSPAWVQWTAGIVVALSAYGAVIGYGRRLILQDDGAVFHRPFSKVVMPWTAVRQIGVYQPGGGIGQTEYVYLTTRDRPPAGKWEQDRSVIQIQNRPGLLETIERFRDSHIPDRTQPGAAMPQGQG